jgi:hypothetical protein
MTIRAKMTVYSIEEMSSWTPGTPGQKKVRFTACYDSTLPEDQRFQKATPSASAEFLIDPGQTSALDQIKLGESYYFDISICQKVEAK